MYGLSSEPPDMLSEHFGWLSNEAAKTLSPTTVPHGVTMAPKYILKLIKCQCESESPCSSLPCGCNKAR